MFVTVLCSVNRLSLLFPTCSVVLDVVPHTELELRTRATHTSAQAHTTGQADIKDNQETYDNLSCIVEAIQRGRRSTTSLTSLLKGPIDASVS